MLVAGRVGRGLASKPGSERLGVESAFAKEPGQHVGKAVCDKHAAGPRGLDRREQPWEVGVVGEHKALFDAAAAADAADSHPAGGHRGRRCPKHLEPRAIEHARRRDHECPAAPDLAGPRRHAVDRRQPHAAGPVGLAELHDRAMGHDRPDLRIDERRDPLGLPQGVGKDHACAAGVAVGPPPGVDFAGHRRRVGPAIDRQPEGAFGDEHVAGHRLKCGAGGIGSELVVAGHHPGLAAVLDPHLRRAEHVAGRVE